MGTLKVYGVSRMCEHGDTVPMMIRMPPEQSHTGDWLEREWPIDRCIAPIVAALQAAEIWTLGSCCGHGKGPGEIPLMDGRWLTIPEVYEPLKKEIGVRLGATPPESWARDIHEPFL